MQRTFELVLRADDLLYCQFELVNLTLGASASGAPRLTRGAAGPAFIVMRLPPQAIAEQVVPPTGAEPALPFGAGLAGPTRLTFLVPDNVDAIDFRLDALLALVGGANLAIANDLAGETTAIEWPDRLLLVPQPSSKLIHRADAVTSKSTGVTELWHTSLSDRAIGVSPRLQAIANPSDRADQPFATALRKADRDAIVTLSAQSADIASSVFRLTALGTTARVKSDWPPVSPMSALSLTEWEHQSELGRESYVRTVHQGYLFPFGHRAALTTVTQRQIASHFPLQTAELAQQSFLTILEFARFYDGLAAYPGMGREMPFVQVNIASAPATAQPEAPIAVSLLLIDRAGNHIDCNATVFFVAADKAADPGELAALNANFRALPAVALRGQRVALAENDGAIGDTGLNIDFISFGVKLPSDLVRPAVPPFLPFMAAAQARIPALEQMVGATANATTAAQRRATGVAYHESYLRTGLTDAKQVFAKFAPIANLAIPPERAGGLAAPKFPGVDGLSRLTGLVAGVDGFVNGAVLQPEELVGDAKLLGVIPLKDVIAAVAGDADPFPVAQASELFDSIENTASFLPRPVINTVANASGVETRFIWKPRINGALPPPLTNPSSTMQLILKGRILAGAGSPTSPPAFSVQGKLTNFALSILGLVTVRFDSLEFSSQSGAQSRRQAARRGGRVFRKPRVRRKAAAAFANHGFVWRAPGADAARRRDGALRHSDPFGAARRDNDREFVDLIDSVASLRRR